MNRKLSIVLIYLLILLLSITFVACNNSEKAHTHIWNDGVVTKQSTFNSPGTKLYACECGSTKTETIERLIPTTQQIVNGRTQFVDSDTQNYDFYLNFNGVINLYGFNGQANANYEGKYRYNKNTKALKFYRKTSGVLLYDSQEYIYTENDNRIKVKANENGEVKSVSIIPTQDQELMMINLPFSKLVDSLDATNITAASLNTSGNNTSFGFVTALQLSSTDSNISKILQIIGLLGMNITINNVTFPNLQGGFLMYFNMSDDGIMQDYLLSCDIQFPVKGIPTKLTLTYSQKATNTNINIPSISGIVITPSNIQSEIININNAIANVKDDDAYSIDLTAVNDFDPGWKTTAIKDQYISRLYKNTNDSRVDFNQSFKYKAHTEEEGAESYTYTIGNIQSGEVYEISRKGTNTNKALSSINVDTQFDYLTSSIILNSTNIDCIKKVTNKDGSIKYSVFVNKTQSYSMQQIIADIINSNEADGVIDVDNYFNNSNYSLKESEFIYVVKDGKLVSANVNIELKYVPTGGEYTESTITLKNTISLVVNDKIDDAEEYVAPKSVETKIGSIGLNNVKYYIL